MGKRRIVFTDTETAGLQLKLTRPFADAIYTPRIFGIDFGRKHVRFKGFKELAFRAFAYNVGRLETIFLPFIEDFYRAIPWKS
jgi:hypothetical protein